MLSLVEITAFRLESKLPPMRALEFIRDHVTFKLPYDFSYQMKTPHDLHNSLPKYPMKWTINRGMTSLLELSVANSTEVTFLLKN